MAELSVGWELKGGFHKAAVLNQIGEMSIEKVDNVFHVVFKGAMSGAVANGYLMLTDSERSSLASMLSAVSTD